MPLEAPLAPVDQRARDLNARYRHHSATSVVKHALGDPQVGRVAMVSSFGAESVALLHLVSLVDRSVPVLFLDTQMLFPETLAYQLEVADRLGLTDVRTLSPDRTEQFLRDPEGDLHLSDPDACCSLRKVEPLEDALEPFDAWITGRKRYQGGTRTALNFFEAEGTARIKINPLAHWAPGDVRDYIENNRLPKHPLVNKGFPSLGCVPCTTRVAEGEDPRAGRWRGRTKQECGIHFINGKAVRLPHVALGDGT
jgi:phosphoadenosine phosphosulfate reductase